MKKMVDTETQLTKHCNAFTMFYIYTMTIINKLNKEVQSMPLWLTQADFTRF